MTIRGLLEGTKLVIELQKYRSALRHNCKSRSVGGFALSQEVRSSLEYKMNQELTNEHEVPGLGKLEMCLRLRILIPGAGTIPLTPWEPNDVLCVGHSWGNLNLVVLPSTIV